jgi:hypothetical protein
MHQELLHPGITLQRSKARVLITRVFVGAARPIVICDLWVELDRYGTCHMPRDAGISVIPATDAVHFQLLSAL